MLPLAIAASLAVAASPAAQICVSEHKHGSSSCSAESMETERCHHADQTCLGSTLFECVADSVGLPILLKTRQFSELGCTGKLLSETMVEQDHVCNLGRSADAPDSLVSCMAGPSERRLAQKQIEISRVQRALDDELEPDASGSGDTTEYPLTIPPSASTTSSPTVTGATQPPTPSPSSSPTAAPSDFSDPPQCMFLSCLEHAVACPIKCSTIAPPDSTTTIVTVVGDTSTATTAQPTASTEHVSSAATDTIISTSATGRSTTDADMGSSVDVSATIDTSTDTSFTTVITEPRSTTTATSVVLVFDVNFDSLINDPELQDEFVEATRRLVAGLSGGDIPVDGVGDPVIEQDDEGNTIIVFPIDSSLDRSAVDNVQYLADTSQLSIQLDAANVESVPGGPRTTTTGDVSQTTELITSTVPTPTITEATSLTASTSTTLFDGGNTADGASGADDDSDSSTVVIIVVVIVVLILICLLIAVIIKRRDNRDRKLRSAANASYGVPANHLPMVTYTRTEPRATELDDGPSLAETSMSETTPQTSPSKPKKAGGLVKVESFC